MGGGGGGKKGFEKNTERVTNIWKLGVGGRESQMVTDKSKLEHFDQTRTS